ncbi:glycosyltransferase [Cellulomonas edaphi]|uniref:Glycosyltransferase n=1 Tax=Cellulomonas edaphi TaxID=3053468 RepID=A0ABT7S4Y6_9CELL|nr:glycosyltransferase [Cellulomons edaphi]MDM7830688.1 glycosyltransferase [Cellulomons edaphi]
MADDELRVLQSFREPRRTTNPYLVQLRESLEPFARVQTFSWPRALRGRYDVLHVHWPEVVVERRNPLRHWGASALFALAVVQASRRGRVIVRTAHNQAPHDEVDRATRLVSAWCDRRTAAWIRLNERTPTPPGALARTIAHGDYTAWFAPYPRREPVPGRLVHVGLIKPYKGAEELLAAFAALDDPDAGLVVAGRPTTEELRAAVTASAARDPRVHLDLAHIDDAELVGWVTSAELVVLPYRSMHNSGAVLLALSLGRPVLVPRNDVNDDLAAEVGERWVHRYDGPLTAEVLAGALAACRAQPATGQPDLTGRAWPALGAAHAALYAQALGRSPVATAPVGGAA